MNARPPLDLRDLPPPQPLEHILDALDGLEEGQELAVLLAREPYPLYRLLERDGFRYTATWQAPDACLVVIRHAQD